jgi:phenylacetyl-CoA:acceptor oxidoreductase
MEVKEDVWIPTLCESQCADAPCLVRVHRVNGVAVGVEPNTEIEDYQKITKNQGRLCPKAYGVIQKIYHPDRIKTPLKRTNPEKGRGIDPGWVPISWEEALDTLAEKMKKIRAEDPRKLAEGGGIGGMRQAGWAPFFKAFGPCQSLIGGRSTRCDQNEHAFANRIHGGFQCEPDVDYCKYLILIGSNTSASGGTPEGVLFAQARDRGMKIIALDPVLTVTAAKADEWIPIKPGTDLAFLLAMIHGIIHELATYDIEFLKEMTNSPYLVKPDGLFLRDEETNKVLVWDSSEGRTKTYDDISIKELTLEGVFEVQGKILKTAFQSLKEQVAGYTPEWAASITDIPAEKIREITREFLEQASIGSTIELDGQTFPYRPVATKLGRGVTGVMRSYQVVLANHILAALVGSIEVPGGHMGGGTFQKGKTKDGILWKLYGLDSGIIPGPDGMRDFPQYPIIWPPITYSGIELLCPMSDYAPAKPPYDDPQEFHFQMDHLNWRNLVNPPKNFPMPPAPELWIRYRTNPLLALGEEGVIREAIQKIPFVVSISYVMDEVTDFADLVLPEQVEFERYMPYFNMRNACHKKYFMLALAQPVVNPTGALNINDILIQLADRIGMLDDYNAVLNQKLGLQGPNALEPGTKYSWMEISDKLCRHYTSNAHDLEWFKRHGVLARQAEVEDQYDIHLQMKALKLRYPLPYMEQVKIAGESLASHLSQMKIDWWSTEEYTPLPTYFPSKLEEVPAEYDFYVTTCRVIMFSYGSNLCLPWINELSQHLPDQVHILMHAGRAGERGIAEGDEVFVESIAGKVKGKVILRQGIRPDTLLIAGQFGQWAMPVARDKGRVTLSSLLPIRPDWTDPVTGVQQGLVMKAKVYKP